jgi:hypothetical protein
MPSMICGGGDGGSAANWRSETISGNGGGTAPKSTAMSTCSATQTLHHLGVLTKRRKRIAIILLALIGGVIAYSLLHQSDEPEYHGRRLSEWLVWRTQADFYKAETAVRAIGTNAVPYLLKWIKYEIPPWRISLDKKVPAFVNRGPIRGWIQGRASWLAFYAPDGFRFLGTNAVSAIPELEVLMKDTTKPERSGRAIRALTSIGEPAIPVLRAALADTNRTDGDRIIYAFWSIADLHGTNTCLPILVEALNHDDLDVRSEATNAVRGLAPQLLFNSPPQ